MTYPVIDCYKGALGIHCFFYGNTQIANSFEKGADFSSGISASMLICVLGIRRTCPGKAAFYPEMLLIAIFKHCKCRDLSFNDLAEGTIIHSIWSK